MEKRITAYFITTDGLWHLYYCLYFSAMTLLLNKICSNKLQDKKDCQGIDIHACSYTLMFPFQTSLFHRRLFLTTSSALLEICASSLQHKSITERYNTCTLRFSGSDKVLQNDGKV